MINYLPTVTAIGHTSIYTGTTPAFHGICGNAFYVNGVKRSSCEDPDVKTVGTDKKDGPRRSVTNCACIPTSSRR